MKKRSKKLLSLCPGSGNDKENVQKFFGSFFQKRTSFSVALLRHPAVAVAPGICYGRTDVALSEAPAQVFGLKGCVWSSPARRCRETAEALGLGVVRLDARLQEMDFGAWEGRAWDDVPRAELDAWAADPWHFTPPGGESAAALVARVTAFCAVLRAEAVDCVVVSHGGPLKCLAALLAGRAVDVLAPAQGLGEVRVLEVVA